MRFPLLALPALLAGGCSDQPIANGSYGSTTPRIERPEADDSLLDDTVVAVRIGELGPNFAACNAQGEVRARATDGQMPVRAAPYDQARQKDALPPDSTFFICSRSHDQRWLGIVYEPPGRAARACGVSAPITERRDYEGACESGWVLSSQVRLVSGVEPPTGEASQNGVQPN